MSAAVRPIHLPTAAAFVSLRQTVRAALEVWAREWVPGWPAGAPQSESLQISLASDDPQLPERDYEETRAQSGRIWFRTSAADHAAVGRAVLGQESMPGAVYADAWTAVAVESAWYSRNRVLCSSLIGAPESNEVALREPPANLFAFGSGALRISCDALGLHAIADGTSWLRSAPSQRASARRLPTLTPVDRAAQRARVRLEVRLGGVDVELPKLSDLRRGDVLRLPLRLDQALPVLCEGKPLARAVLGESQGHRCVQVTSRDE